MMAQRYIPGLTPRPDVTTVTQASAPKDVPQDLIDSFLNGDKHPVSSLMEFSAMKRLNTTFKEVPLKNYSIVNKFANECSVDGVQYPQGSGKTKAEAKKRAAEIALKIILGVEDFETYGEPNPHEPQEVYNRDRQSRFTKPEGEYEPIPQQKDVNKIFNEYCRVMNKNGLIEVPDDPGPFGFVARIKFSGRQVAEATGKTKKHARQAAIKSAVEVLQMEHALHERLTKDSMENIFAKECYKVLEQLLQKCVNIPNIREARHSFAAFIVKRSVNDKGEVVAFGTGNTLLSVENITTDGRSLVDSYALATARRSLLKYFHKEIKSYFESAKVLSIFEESEEHGILKLKDHITIHLYLNHPLPGDYRECLDIKCDLLTEAQEAQLEDGAHFPAFNEDLPGWFSVKNEDAVEEDEPPFQDLRKLQDIEEYLNISFGLVEAVEEDQPPFQDFSKLQEGEEDLLVMSCSDKLLLYNIVGVQGALYSNFMRPIYLTSIVQGNQYDHRHLARAACGRMYQILENYLPPHYKINYPILSTVTMEIEELHGKPTSHSLNWSVGDENPEVVEGFSGKVVDGSPHRTTKNAGPCSSRLCKAAFLSRYRDIGNLLQNYRALQTPTYLSAKQLAEDYQAAKTVFRKFAEKTGLGCWVQKPKEIENFQK